MPPLKICSWALVALLPTLTSPLWPGESPQTASLLCSQSILSSPWARKVHTASEELILLTYLCHQTVGSFKAGTLAYSSWYPHLVGCGAGTGWVLQEEWMKDTCIVLEPLNSFASRMCVRQLGTDGAATAEQELWDVFPADQWTSSAVQDRIN